MSYEQWAAERKSKSLTLVTKIYKEYDYWYVKYTKRIEGSENDTWIVKVFFRTWEEAYMFACDHYRIFDYALQTKPHWKLRKRILEYRGIVITDNG